MSRRKADVPPGHEIAPMNRVADTVTVEYCHDCACVHLTMTRRGKLVGIAAPVDLAGFIKNVEAAMQEMIAHQRGLH